MRAEEEEKRGAAVAAPAVAARPAAASHSIFDCIYHLLYCENLNASRRSSARRPPPGATCEFVFHGMASRGVCATV